MPVARSIVGRRPFRRAGILLTARGSAAPLPVNYPGL